MRKIIFAAIVALIMSVQSFSGAAEISETRSCYHEDVIYPVVSTGDAAIDKKINAAIMAEVDRFLTGIYRGAQVNGYEVAAVSTSYEVPCNGAGNTVILSVVLTEYSFYKMAAHPSTYKRTLNFNMASGELMGTNYLTDVGAGIPIENFIDKLNQKLLDKAKREDIHLFPDALPLKKLPENFYWDENLHRHFIFNQYEVAPYAWGIIDIDFDE